MKPCRKSLSIEFILLLITCSTLLSLLDEDTLKYAEDGGLYGPVRTVASSRLFSIISQLLLTYFPVFPRIFSISQLFLSYFLLISFISQFPNHFWSISQSFLTSQLYFSVTSPVISRLFPGYFSSCEDHFLTFRTIVTTFLTWFA